jgi:arylsulfatase A-like enzyme
MNQLCRPRRLCAILVFSVWTALHAAEKPNVILIVADDQGYGDLSAHSNPVLKTPNMDRLYSESVRFTDFHVAPMCSPTRGQLMTGRDAMKSGCTAVCQGRSIPRRDIPTMANFFADSGYTTGHFGKWHLGDSYPFRPQDRGFQETIHHRAWGITSLADYWGNTYFDPVLNHNGVDSKYQGYCTDIFFAEAMHWIEGKTKAEEPFFVYLPTNTPHVPNVCAEKYSAPYVGEHDGKKIPAEFYGMIANLDENLGKLEAFLNDTQLRDNTILIYMSDNGTQSRQAQEIFNAGMRDKKTSVYEGGHRVPCFVRWPAGGLLSGKDIDELTQVQDLLPTLIELCDLRKGNNATAFDGASLADLMKGVANELADRKLVVQYKVSGAPWDPAVVLWDKWRLIGGTELYHVGRDPGQAANVADQHSEVVKAMAVHYEAWYAEAKPLFDRPRWIHVGTEKQNPMMLYAQDWVGDYCDNMGGLTRATAVGSWTIEVAQQGVYELELRRWPIEADMALAAGIAPDGKKGQRPIMAANVQIDGGNYTLDAAPDAKHVTFHVPLKPGKTQLATLFLDEQDQTLCSAMYVKATRLPDPAKVQPTPISSRKPVGRPEPAVRPGKNAAVKTIQHGKDDILFALPSHSQSAEKPNVLFIAIDDMNDWTTLFEENNPIQTPNLERLAARGTFFTRAYCAAPGCNPSRTAILSGLRPTTSGVYGNRDSWQELIPDVVTLPQHFKNNGYGTRGAGKIFHHGKAGADREDNPSFEDFYPLNLHANAPSDNYNGYTGKDVDSRLGKLSWDWGEHDAPKQTDEYTVDYVNQVMATFPKEQPLFLAAGIFRPHLPFWAPPETFAKYPFDRVVQPPMPANDLDDVPPIGKEMAHTEYFIWANTSKQPEAGLGSLKKMVQSYQAAADYADQMVGRLLNQLDATGRAGDTIIVLWADHGYHLGDKEACVKFTLWEKANRVPFIIVAPGGTTPGTRCDQPVGLVDIYPTLIELAGLPPKADLDGKSLVPLLKNPAAKWDRPAIMTQLRGNHAVRSERWRYIRYSDGTEELYDHDQDPWEWKNLSGIESYASVIADHRKYLPKNEAAAKPQRVIPGRSRTKK